MPSEKPGSDLKKEKSEVCWKRPQTGKDHRVSHQEDHTLTKENGTGLVFCSQRGRVMKKTPKHGIHEKMPQRGGSLAEKKLA